MLISQLLRRGFRVLSGSIMQGEIANLQLYHVERDLVNVTRFTCARCKLCWRNIDPSSIVFMDFASLTVSEPRKFLGYWKHVVDALLVYHD
ncbi:hypothetical protein R1flu_010462 [Riccia fluitans]|uniref:Uncharacterized protein n=1 Tax=Riccia fluitans TaxID=41844 RepID=A0ABD1Z5U7_9MARC